MNITLTGHSLGGALAGYVGSRSDADAFVFDPIPFGEVATADAFRDAFLKTIRDLDLSDATGLLADILVGPLDPFDLIPDSDFTVEDFAAEFARNIAASVPDFTRVSGRFLEGEIAAQIPALQTIIGVRLAEFGTTITPFATLLGTQLVALGLDQAQQGLVNASTGDRNRNRVTPVSNRDLPDMTILQGSGDSIDLHSQTTLTLMLFGERQWSPSTESGGEGGGLDWERAIRFVIPSITSEEIAAGLGLDGDTGAAPAGSQLANTITYSILNEGELIYGNTGARASGVVKVV